MYKSVHTRVYVTINIGHSMCDLWPWIEQGAIQSKAHRNMASGRGDRMKQEIGRIWSTIRKEAASVD